MTAEAPKEIDYIPKLLLMLVNRDMELILFSQDPNMPNRILAIKQGARVSLIDRSSDLCIMKGYCDYGPLVRIEEDKNDQVTHDPRFDRKLINIPADFLQPHPREIPDPEDKNP